MNASDFGIILEIIGLILVLGPIRYTIIIISMGFHIASYTVRLIAKEEKSNPQNWKVKERTTITNSAIRNGINKFSQDNPYEHILGSYYGIALQFVGICLVIIGLTLQFSFW